MLTAQGSHPFKPFFWTVVSEGFANFAVLSLGGGGSVSPRKSRKSDFVPWKQHIKQIRSQCQCHHFGQIKQQRDLFKKMAPMLGLINLIACLIGEVLTPLNCCKVLAGNSYRVFTRKIQNDSNTSECLSWLIDKHLSESFLMGLPVNVFESSEL
jgi:hypothetical protein